MPSSWARKSIETKHVELTEATRHENETVSVPACAGSRGAKRKREKLTSSVQSPNPEVGAGTARLKQTKINSQVEESKCPVCFKVMSARKVQQHLDMCIAMHESKSSVKTSTLQPALVVPEESTVTRNKNEVLFDTQDVVPETQTYTANMLRETQTPEEISSTWMMSKLEDVTSGMRETNEASESLTQEESQKQKSEPKMVNLQVELKSPGTNLLEEEPLSAVERSNEHFTEDSDDDMESMELELRKSLERLVTDRAMQWYYDEDALSSPFQDLHVDLDDDPVMMSILQQYREPKPKMVIATTQLTQRQRQQVSQAITLLGGKETRVTKEATHIIVPTDEQGIATDSRRMLEMVAKGAWTLSLDWVLESLAQREWVEEGAWEVTGVSNMPGHDGPRRSRLEKGCLFRDFLVSFHGHFGRNGIPPRQYLEELATAAGAEMYDTANEDSKENRPKHVILCASHLTKTELARVARGSAKAAGWAWLPASISAHTLQPRGRWPVPVA